MIELRGKWVVTTALFNAPGQEKFEELGITTYEVMEPTPIRFKLENLISYNEGNPDRPTTILLSSGDLYSLDIPFEKFDEFISKQEKWKITI